MELCVCQWVCPDISVKGSACVEVGAQSKVGQVAKEMCLWALKSGSRVPLSALLLARGVPLPRSLPTAPPPLPLPPCLSQLSKEQVPS